MNPRIEVIDDRISNWLGPSPVGSISCGCDKYKHQSRIASYHRGHVCDLFGTIDVTSSGQMMYFIWLMKSQHWGADFRSKWYSIRAEATLPYSQHCMSMRQNKENSERWQKISTIWNRKSRVMSWSGVIGGIKRSGFICRECRSLTAGDKLFPLERKS